MSGVSTARGWSPDADPAEVIDVTARGGWDYVADKYAAGDRPALQRIIEIGREHKIKSVLVERRYIDPDYRSEYARFYASMFRPYPATCHRLHFFTAKLKSPLQDLGQFQDAYRGYSIMRPIPSHPVGRTMLSPPPSLGNACLSMATDVVLPFGYQLAISAVPYISGDPLYQDAGEAVQWMVLYHAHLVHGIARHLAGERLGGDGGPVPHSTDTSTSRALIDGLRSSGMNPIAIALPPSREASRKSGLLSLPAILSRYLDSNIPPIVLSNSHSWLVVGYKERSFDPIADHDDQVFLRHDPNLGPYLTVEDPWNEHHGQFEPWVAAVPVMPSRVLLSAERAELIGRLWLRQAAHAEHLAPVLDAEGSKSLAFRTYVIRSNDFKRRLTGRVPAELEMLLRLSSWPGYVWIVEAIDKRLKSSGLPHVLGEAILDSTLPAVSRPEDPVLNAVLGIHLAGKAFVPDVGEDAVRVLELPRWSPYTSASQNG